MIQAFREPEGLRPQRAAAEAGRCLSCHDAPCVRGCPAGVNVPAFVRKIHTGNLKGAARVVMEANVFGGVCARVCPAQQLCEGECAARLLGRAVPIAALQRVACDYGRARGPAGPPAAAHAPVSAAHAPVSARSAASAYSAVGAYGRAVAPIAAGGAPHASAGGAPHASAGGAPHAPAGVGPGPGAPAPRRAAVVGGGPAGLAAACELKMLGWDVSVYEASARLGGQPALTVPPWRLPPAVLEAEVAAILDTGVKARLGVRVGRDVAAARLLMENDAVILAAGLGARRPGDGIPGEDLDGVVPAEAFLYRARHGGFGGEHPSGRQVVVVGGGNTAMDAAVTAARAGAAWVTVLYRRTARQMPAWPREYAAAQAERVEFSWRTQPLAFEPAPGMDGGRRVGRVRCARMRAGPVDASGRPAPERGPEPEFYVPADLVVLALGQGTNLEVLHAFGLGPEDVGLSGDPSGRTRRDKVYIAGDLASGGATVVAAVAAGRRAARTAAAVALEGMSDAR
jgi:dihydropyrimidine dehydrogenase (NAD+) subunit PreT